MVLKTEFEKVQRIMCRPGKPAPQRHVFPFTGLIRCGECGGGVTAEHKVNRHGSRYIYYHCTRQRPCRQPSIRGEHLEAQILAFLESLTVDPQEEAAYQAKLRTRQTVEREALTARQLALAKEQRKLQRERDNVLSLRLQEFINDAEFIAARDRIARQEVDLDKRMQEEAALRSAPQETPPEDLCAALLRGFREGDAHTKRQTVARMISSSVLTNARLICEAANPFVRQPSAPSESHAASCS